jgi:predicted membrane-bound spermidine synthase
MAREDSVVTIPAAGTSAPAKASIVWLGAVLLLSASGLMFELMLTRVFSATIWYHYTFVAISVALLGWGLGGFLVYVLGLAKYPQQARSILIVLSLVLSVTLQVFLYTILQLPFTPDRLNLYFLLSILPFLAGGAALSLAFEVNGKDINRLYFVDLVGAAAGVLIVPLVIGLLGAETAILATAVLPALAAALLSTGAGDRPRRGWQVVAGLVLVGNVAIAGGNYKNQWWTINDAPSKALYKLLAEQPQARIVSDHWNAYSRITAVRNPDNYHVARLFIDSDAETSVLPWDGTNLKEDGRHWFRAFPLQLVKQPKVLVIGPGGGTDVVMAFRAGSQHVTGVEMNPLMVDAVRQFGPEAGRVYDDPRMHLVLDEGRNFIQRTTEGFDAIILGFVDSWASVASGGLSLTENYLYTREALEAYYDRLSADGTLVIVRWPSDVPRLVANSVAFLRDRGMTIDQIGRHILAVSERVPKSTAQGPEPVETIFMLTKSPLSAEKTAMLLKDFQDAHIFWSIDRPSEKPYADLFAGRSDFAAYTEAFDQMATPVNDDHPFYFATDKQWWGIPAFAVRLVAIPVGAVIGFTLLLLIAGKLLHFRAPGGRTILYFGALGVGFIIVEVALMQRLILLLGHPIYTLVVILFTLLLAGGIGSRFAGRFAAGRIYRALGVILPLVILLVLVAAFALPLVVQAAVPLTQTQRIAVAVALTFPFGFLMGMPFPLGLRRHAQDPTGAPISSLWGINGVASVVGSIAGMMIAVAAGFTWVFVVGAVCYAVAWATRPR